MAIEKDENDQFATEMRQWQRGWNFTDNDKAAITDVMMGKGYSNEQAQYVIDRASNSSFYDHNTNAQGIDNRWAAIQYEFEQAGVPELGDAVKAEAEARATASSTWQFSDRQQEQIEDIFDKYGYTTDHSDSAMNHAQNSSFSDYDADENKWDDLESQVDAATQISSEDKEAMKADIDALRKEEENPEPEVSLPPEEDKPAEEEAEVEPEDTTPTNTSETDAKNSNVLDYEEWLSKNENGTWDGYLSYLESNGVDTFKSTIEELQPDYGNGSFRTQDIENMISGFGSAANNLEDVITNARSIEGEYENLNEDTRRKLAGTEVGDGAQLQAEILKTIENMKGFALDIKSDLEEILSKIDDANGTQTEGEDPIIDDRLPGGGSSGYHGSSSGSSSGGDIGGITGTDNTPNVFIESAVVGTLTFSTIVPLFEELGKPSTIQSSLTGEYDVVGIFQHEGKYYYRIYDKKLKKFYYAEIDNNSTFTTDYAEVLKMNEDAMMLSSPNIGQNVLTKMTDINEVYFVNGTLPGEGDYVNITFANILDGMDGKNYYVPLSDSVEMVTLDVFKSGILGDTPTIDTNASTDVSNNVG